MNYIITYMILVKFLYFIITLEMIVSENPGNSDDNEVQELHDISTNTAKESAEDKLQSNNTKRNTNASDLRWPLGIVPYYVDENSYDNIITRRIRSAMNTIEDASCVLFKPLKKKPENAEESWLYFTNPAKERECNHEPVYPENVSIIIVLGYECLRSREVLHALLHALGFIDEVCHPQRDLYVKILWENIQTNYRRLFRVRGNNTPHKTMVEYDPLSIMQFHDRAFSTNGAATIAPLIPGLVINPSDKLSQLDIMKLRLYFGAECNKRKLGDLLDTCKNILHEHPNKTNTDNNSNKSINGEIKDEEIKTENEDNEDQGVESEHNEEHSNEDSTNENDNNEDSNNEYDSKDDVDKEEDNKEGDKNEEDEDSKGDESVVKNDSGQITVEV